MFDSFLGAFGNLTTFSGLMYLMIGVVIGSIVAVLPGIGTVQTIALLLPLTFGVLGYLMMLFDYPRITLVIALTLGELTERSIHQSMGISNGNWEIFVHNRRIDPPLRLFSLRQTIRSSKTVSKTVSDCRF